MEDIKHYTAILWEVIEVLKVANKRKKDPRVDELILEIIGIITILESEESKAGKSISLITKLINFILRKGN